MSRDPHTWAARAGLTTLEIQLLPAGAGQSLRETQSRTARVGQPSAEAQSTDADAGHIPAESHLGFARVGHSSTDTHFGLADAGDPLLFTIRHLGRLLDDLEHTRVANGNRIGAAQRDIGDPLPGLLIVQDQLAQVEHQAELELVRAWRHHPLAPWAKSLIGVGEKSIARLISNIGNPADRPNPGKLLAYCGHGEPLRKRGSGMSQEELFRCGNPEAKKHVYLIAVACMKNRRSPYRAIYEERRQATLERTHERACVRCGPSGHPAVAGSPWSDAHKHADALRIVGKRFLIDLWAEARAGHDSGDDQN